MRASVTKLRELGSASMVSAVKTCCRVADRTSMASARDGHRPATAPTRSSALTTTCRSHGTDPIAPMAAEFSVNVTT
jgi:hypothetical protein